MRSFIRPFIQKSDQPLTDQILLLFKIDETNPLVVVALIQISCSLAERYQIASPNALIKFLGIAGKKDSK